MSNLYLKIIMLLSTFFTSDYNYEEITIKDNIISIELNDGTIQEHRIELISPKPAVYPTNE